MSSTDNEKRIKHLEFIQLVITRMNVNSFMIKGWLVTLIAAIFVLSSKDANLKFLWIAPVVSIIFWSLDGFFLSTEKMYRDLYNVVRIKAEVDIDFSMDTSAFKALKNHPIVCMGTLSLLLFYAVIVVASLIASIYFNI